MNGVYHPRVVESCFKHSATSVLKIDHLKGFSLQSSEKWFAGGVLTEKSNDKFANLSESK